MDDLPVLYAPAFLHHAPGPLPCIHRPQLFHSDDKAAQEVAVDLCLDCPLMLACRDWARTHGEYGVAGGETQAERAAAGRAPIKAATTKPKSSCGTEYGAQRHRKQGEPVCDACTEAARIAQRNRRRAREALDATVWPPHLTPREQQIIEAMAEGLHRAAIAAKLGIHCKAVSTTTCRIRRKLRTDNDHLVQVAREAGLLPAATEYVTAA